MFNLNNTDLVKLQMQDVIQDFQQQTDPTSSVVHAPAEEPPSWQDRAPPAFHAAADSNDINDDCCHICGLQVISPSLEAHSCDAKQPSPTGEPWTLMFMAKMKAESICLAPDLSMTTLELYLGLR